MPAAAPCTPPPAPSHYDVSMACGERVLLPTVRGPDTLVIADGFSYRTQIADGTGRRALHLAQVARMASTPSPRRPGEPHLHDRRSPPRPRQDQP